MTRVLQIARAASANWFALGITFVVAFFLTPFVIHQLGLVSYGIWMLVGSMVSYFGLLDLGLRSAITRFVASDSVRNEHENASQVVSAAFWFRLWTAAVVILGTALISLFANRAFHIPAEQQTSARWAILFSGCSLAFSLAFGVFGGVVAARHRFDLLSEITIAQTLVRAAGVVLLLRAGKGILALASWEFAVVLFIGAITVLAAFRVYPELHFSIQKPPREIFRKIGGHSVYAFIASIGVQLIYYTDTIVVGSVVSVSAVTIYAIGGSIIEYLRQIVSSLTQTFAPLSSQMQALQQNKQMRALLIIGTRASLLIALPIETALLVRGPTFLGLWIGAQYAHDSGHVLRVLLIAQLFALANFTSGNIAFGIGKHKPVAVWAICEAVANLVLSIFLAKRIGLYGVAWGTAIPSVIIHLLLWPRYVCSIVDVSVFTYLWQAWIRPFLAVLPFAGACYLADRYWPATNLVFFFLQILAILPVYGLGVLLCFHTDILGFLRSRFALFPARNAYRLSDRPVMLERRANKTRIETAS
jgi:O-antigen/teichoic acid export membrane protein